MHIITVVFSILLLASTALAQTPILVKDINPGNPSGILPNSNAAVVGNTMYFNTSSDTLEDNLWKTDGTEAGTVFVKNFSVDFEGNRQNFYAVYNDQLYFTARQPGTGKELWHTDDLDGAVLAAGDLCPGPCSGAYYLNPTSNYYYVTYNGKLFFQHSRELWSSDGTTAGTKLFKDIDPVSGGYGYPFGFAVFQGKLYFAADSADTSTELWTSDGTAEGTHLLKNINTSPYGNCRMGTPVVGTDAFYFWATDNNDKGTELWKSDGTAAGTMQLKEIRPGNGSGQPGYFGSIPLTNSAWVGNQLLFSAEDDDAGAELWVTDGTEAGTKMLVNIRPGSLGSSIQFFAAIAGKAYFRARGSEGHELWVSDGTVAGTHLVKDINPGNGHGISPDLSLRYAINGNKIYFTANDGAHGEELWVTDGTTAGTQMVFDLNPGSMGSSPTNFKVMGDFLYFFATTQTTGTELWKLSLPTSATSELDKQLDIAIYPTFSKEGIFYCSYSGDQVQVLDIQVFDTFGRLAYHTEQSVAEALRISTLSTGAYFIRIATAEGKFSTQKVIIGR